MVDFTLDDKTQEIKEKVRQFLAEEVIPREGELDHGAGNLEALRGELQDRAKKAGIFLPHLPEEVGGLGLNWRQTAVVLEEAGRSLLGPQALNAAAPDEANMHLLYHAGDKAQRARYLEPLAEGEIRSCFAMTEPAPGAGSDPSLLRSTAKRKNGEWTINGNKWFTTGADGAEFAIVLVQTPEGPTMFLVETDNPGFRLQRNIPTMDEMMPGGHGQVALDDCAVDDGAVLGEVGKGFEYAQIRLGPARLTH